MMLKLPSRDFIIDTFEKVCGKIDIEKWQHEISNLVIYDMTDGTRTSTDLKGEKAYFDGGIFVARLLHILKELGAKYSYINVIHEDHKKRVNYLEIYNAMRKHVEVYRELAIKSRIKLRFIGNYNERLEPPEYQNHDLRSELKELEELTQNYDTHTAHFLINYSSRWASKVADERWYKELPEANVILRHTKGYVNGDMWIYGKLDNNSFVYVQNGSSNINWSDKQLIWLVALCLRSYILNKGTHLSKVYKKGEDEIVKKRREIELYMLHKNFYDKNANDGKLPKRVVIFSPYGPEIYEF